MESTSVIAVSAAGIAAVHVLAGPDHYLPFIALGRAQRWSLVRTLAVTAACGFGHVLSSIVIAFLVSLAALNLASGQALEAMRGDWAAYGLVLFGAVYAIWGIWRAHRSRHDEDHDHAHRQGHDHTDGHEHDHVHGFKLPRTTFLWLFIIFVLGPCEPMIPLIMAPALKGSWLGMIMVSALFATVTVAVMVITVAGAWLGLRQLRLPWLERYMHAMAGVVIFVSGAGMAWLGL